jgi:vacuolar-type H+-ATPase subunit H
MLFTIDAPFSKEEQLTKQQQEQLDVLDEITESIRKSILSGHVRKIHYEADTVAETRVAHREIKTIAPHHRDHNLMWRTECDFG